MTADGDEKNIYEHGIRIDEPVRIEMVDIKDYGDREMQDFPSLDEYYADLEIFDDEDLEEYIHYKKEEKIKQKEENANEKHE